MKWDAKRRRYVDTNGRVMSARQVRKQIENYVEVEQKEVDRQANKLLIGAITVSAFFDFMRHKVTRWHGVTGVIAYGGENEMDGRRWARVNGRTLSELRFLNQFELAAQASFSAAEAIARQVAFDLSIPVALKSTVQERLAEALVQSAPSSAETVIKATLREVLTGSLGAEEAAAVIDAVTVDKAGAILDQLIGGTIPSRSQMYADAAYSTYENNVAQREADNGVTLARRVCEDDEKSCDECVEAASDDYISLSEVTDIGTLQCLNNCRCFYEFSYQGIEPIRIDETVNVVFARQATVDLKRK